MKIETITICTDDYNDIEIPIEIAQKALKVGMSIANSTNFAKDLVNTIPYEMDSLKLAEVAEELVSLKTLHVPYMVKNF